MRVETSGRVLTFFLVCACLALGTTVRTGRAMGILAEHPGKPGVPGPQTGSCETDADCDDGNVCTDDACIDNQCIYVDNTNPCDDGDACTSGDACSGGACTGGPPLNCDDGNSCTNDRCDPNLGCRHKNNNDPCDDGNACTVSDTCSGAVCVGGPPLDCDDGNVCIDDGCDPGSGCHHENNTDPCDDGDACTANDACLEGSCVGGGPPDCDDANPCTDDSCHPVLGCLHINNNDPCNDGNECTVSDVCSGGQCTGGPPLECDDQNVCTDDSCASQLGCVHVNNTDPCDDKDACTAPDVCSAGDCIGGSPLDCDDGDACTDDSCDPQLGCAHVNNTDPCDDDDLCTVGDVCDGMGKCHGTDVETIPCSGDDDCFGSVCVVETGLCSCSDTPDLCLRANPGELPDENCHEVSAEFVVNIELGYSLLFITGGQFLIGYDPNALAFVSIVTGSEVDPGSPFSVEVSQSVDEVAGRVFFAVSVPLGHSGTRGPAVMASLRFVGIGPCLTDELCFLDEFPFTTRLTDVDGDEVAFAACCTGELLITPGPPVPSCSPSVVVNADAGGTTAVVTWDPIGITDPCDGEVELSCTAIHSEGVNIDHLIESGGAFPVGLSEFECTAAQACGIDVGCAWSVQVNPAHTVDVELQLSPVMADAQLNRCIEFAFFSSCGQSPTITEHVIEFGPPYNFPGHAKSARIKVGVGQYFCATARDPKHTLRSGTALQTDGQIYMGVFLGDPSVGGSWLIGGNLNGDGVIDILDFGIMLSQYLRPVDPDTLCGASGYHADINGDGLVDQIDASFVIVNFLSVDDDTCCPGRGSPVPQVGQDEGPRSSLPFGRSPFLRPVPTTQISVDELAAMGLIDLKVADLNNDGMLDVDDIAAFLNGRRPRSVERSPMRKRRQSRGDGGH